MKTLRIDYDRLFSPSSNVFNALSFKIPVSGISLKFLQSQRHCINHGRDSLCYYGLLPTFSVYIVLHRDKGL